MTAHKTVAAMLCAATLILTACGDSSSGDSGSSAGGNGADRAFVADMVPHHQSAIAMAKIARERGKSAFVKQLAANIIRTQAKEISTLRAEDKRLAAAGIKTGSLGVAQHMMGMDHDPAMLKTAKPFDAAFMKMMIPHHRGAIVMAKAELKKGEDPRLKQLAQAIITAQEREIADMRAQLGSSGSAPASTTTMHHGAAS
jgi:uncharacterized protein (DUF305 family)